MEASRSPDPDMGATPSELSWHGIELCRKGSWQEGFYYLSLVAGDTVETNAVPSLYFAYLGYGLARFQHQPEEGTRLCRLAVSLEMHEPENYYFLAATLLLAGDRRSAVDAIERGLQIDAHHEGLRALQLDIGDRRSPVLPFVARKHVLNRTLGRLRHRFFGPSAHRDETP